MNWFKNAFAVPKADSKGYSREELLLLDKLAEKIHHRKMSLPAILFLETVKPLNFIGSQAMVFFKPFISAFFPTHEYDLLSTMLEDRGTLEVLLRKIEHLQEQKMNKGQDGPSEN